MTSHESIEDRVFAFVARELSEPREKLALSTTLLDDLGMDDDDAVEFFQHFAKEFSVDVRMLGTDWHYYIGPEGFPLRIGLLIVVPGSIISILLIKVFPRLPDWMCFLFGFFLWIGLLVGWRYSRRKKAGPGPQITVQDLIDCAKVRVWTVKIPEDIKTRMATTKPHVRLFQ